MDVYICREKEHWTRKATLHCYKEKQNNQILKNFSLPISWYSLANNPPLSSQSFTPISVPSLQAQSSLLPHTATESCFPYPIQQYSALPVPLSLLHTLVPLFRCNTDLQYRLEIKLSITGVYFSHKNTLFKKPKLTLCSTVQVPTAKTASAPLQPPEQGEHRTTWSRLKIPCWRLMASKMKTGVFSKEYEV